MQKKDIHLYNNAQLQMILNSLITSDASDDCKTVR